VDNENDIALLNKPDGNVFDEEILFDLEAFDDEISFDLDESNDELSVDLAEFEEEESFDLGQIEIELQNQFEEAFSGVELLEQERKNISNPESLGKVMFDQVITEFGNQIGLDLTEETLIQKYDREHPETYDEVKDEIMKDQRYKDANNEMKQKQKDGTLEDGYTGKQMANNDKANLDHVESRKEIFDDPRRKQANIDSKDLANKEENLVPTNENLNKSKKEKSVDDYLDNREAREAKLIEQNEKKNKKVDESNMSDVEKRKQKEKNDKALQNKLDADDELMKQADKTARDAINKDIVKGAVKQVGKKAGQDALKSLAVSALFAMLKEVMNGFVRFLKSQSKSFSNFLAEMKTAIKSFFKKILNVLQAGASAFIGTIISEIFGPIVSTFKKLSSLIKQGVSSFIDAIKYLRDKNNKNEPLSVKIAQVGKIVTTALTAGGALVLGEVFEKFLLTIPVFQTPIPLLGTLANIIGIFLGSLIAGLIGAIAMNLIDKFIAKRLRQEKTVEIIEKQNEVYALRRIHTDLLENKIEKNNEVLSKRIEENDAFLNEQMNSMLSELNHKTEKPVSENTILITENTSKLSDMKDDLLSLLD
jgi:hypothetical protein